jgi:hypothetical protein
MNEMTKRQQFQGWLNSHPTIKGAAVVAESALVSGLVTYGHALLIGSTILSKQGLETFGITLTGSVYLAVKNYLTEQAKAS